MRRGRYQYRNCVRKQNGYMRDTVGQVKSSYEKQKDDNNKLEMLSLENYKIRQQPRISRLNL